MNAVSASATFTPPGANYFPPLSQGSISNVGASPTTYSPPPPDAFIPPPDQKQSGLQFCPDCGQKLQPGALFCTSCGIALDDDYEL